MVAVNPKAGFRGVRKALSWRLLARISRESERLTRKWNFVVWFFSFL